MKRNQIALLLCLLSACAATQSVQNVESARHALELARALGEYVGSQFQPDAPGGVVLVARSGRPILRAAYGLADVAGERKMAVDQALPIGSITKSITAGAILNLLQTGRLSLEDDVRKHVPDAPVGDKLVTIEQLLTHTSGMPNLVDAPDFLEWARAPRSTTELLARTADIPFHFEPGTGFRYSDSGYILLGAALERYVPGDWDHAVRELVGRPLNLLSVESAVRWREHAAVGYTYDGTRFVPAKAMDWSVPHASGGLVATADDLLAWVQAWNEGAVATPELRERAWASRVLPDGTYSGYGFGWQCCDFEGRTAIQHGGWVPGFTASVLHLPDEDLTAIALLNSEGSVEATYLTRRALRLLLTGKPDLPHRVLSPEERSRLVGSYRSQSGALWNVIQEGELISLDLAGRHIKLAAVSATHLCAADSDGTWCFTFELGDDGRAASVASALICEPQSRAHREE
jgi:CubicO group peptidase (beta-lactamase class C family)